MPQPYSTRKDRRSSIAIGMTWASRISNIGIMMAVPPLLGWWGDEKWGASPWLTLLGASFGFAGGMYSIWKISQLLDRDSRQQKSDESSR
ncbi:MAG: AtpZ/AtpI family protein [Planctomycetaceae bacterium]